MCTHVSRRRRRRITAAGGENVGCVERGGVIRLVVGEEPQCGDPDVALRTVACDESPRPLAGQTDQWWAMFSGEQPREKSIHTYFWSHPTVGVALCGTKVSDQLIEFLK